MTESEPTLQEIRARIDARAVDLGRYTIVCARTSKHPVPVSGLRFPDRETAARAVRSAQHYRARLRRYDPQLPYHDLIVCEGSTGSGQSSTTNSHACTRAVIIETNKQPEHAGDRTKRR